MDNNFKNNLKNMSNMINIEISDDQAEKFYDYMNLLLEWNEKMNLTAITEENDIILKHFIDSIIVTKYINDDDKIADVGTGAGFPGIPISIVKIKNKITLIDSLNKRVLFLQEVIKKLNLENVQAVHCRAEDFGQNVDNRESFDIGISRAVANLTTLVEYMIPLVKIGGKCICMKGPDIEDELENAKFAIKELGGEIEKVDKFVLPNSEINRNIIVIKKEKNTPSRYPRKAGIPGKTPLTRK